MHVTTTGRPRTIWCRCGAAEVIAIVPFSALMRLSQAERDAESARYNAGREAFEAAHPHGRDTGHRHVIDDYRALCRPHLGGCRNCGAMPAGRLQFYCSAQCREEFERDHFWGTARLHAIASMTTYHVIPSHDYRGRVVHRPDGTRCTRCAEVCVPEVNHIVPVAGRRPMFGCENHQGNLEVLCHACHVATTREQRAAGLLARARS